MIGLAKKWHAQEMEAEMSSMNQSIKGPLYLLKSYVCFKNSNGTSKKLFFLKGVLTVHYLEVNFSTSTLCCLVFSL